MCNGQTLLPWLFSCLVDRRGLTSRTSWIMATVYSISAIYDNHVRVAINTVFVVLASFMIGLRLWSRRLTRSGLKADDFLVVIALVLLYALYIMFILDVKYGMRRNLAAIPLEDLTNLLKSLFVYQLIYGTIMLTVKLSYLTFFCRVFGIKGNFRRWAYPLMGVVVCWWVANVLQVVVICRPIKLNWSPMSPGTCGNRSLALVLVAAFNIATDVAIMILPMPSIRTLQMQKKKRLGLAFMFSIGLVITAISSVRLAALANLDYENISYSMLDSIFWTLMEPALAITNACLPMLRPSLRSIIPERFLLPTDDETRESHVTIRPSKASEHQRNSLSDDEIELTRTYGGLKDPHNEFNNGPGMSSTIITRNQPKAFTSTEGQRVDDERRIWVKQTSIVTYTGAADV